MNMHLLPVLLLVLASGSAVFLLRFLRRSYLTKPFDGNFVYCPACTSRLVLSDFHGKRRKGCLNCGFVHWRNPVPVAVILIPSGNKLVLVKRKFAPAKGKYALPAGFVDEGETPEDAAIREALEETGLEVEIERLLAVRVSSSGNQILHFYLTKPVHKEPAADDDAESCLLADLSSLPVDLAFSTHKEIVLNYFGAQNSVRN